MHAHGERWRTPHQFKRPHLDWDALVGANAVWGDWREAPGLDAESSRVVEAAAAQVRELMFELQRSGLGRGLIHGDLRLANVLVQDDVLTLIDFDDCAFSWQLFDVATSLSLIEDEPDAPSLLNAWLDGYSDVREVSAVELRSVPHLVMLRRIQVLSWFASHLDTEVTRTYGRAAVAGTVAAAREYIRGRAPFAADLGLAGHH